MKRHLTLAFIAALVAAGCDMKQGSAQAASAPQPRSAARTTTEPVVTAAEWKTKVESQYVISNVRDKGEGVTEFTACFNGAPPKCQQTFFASRDAFRKLRFFTSADAKLKLESASRSVSSYVSLPDCSEPIFYLHARYSGESWIFMREASVMVDDDVVLTITSPSSSSVQRDNNSSGVYENLAAPATDAQISSLRVLAKGSKILVRLTGDKGYVPVKADLATSFQQDVRATLEVYDKLKAAASGASPSSCS